MQIERFLMAGALAVLASAAIAEEWEEVFTETKNSTNAKYYYDRDIIAAPGGAVQTQYMIVEPQPRLVSKSKPEGPSYDKAIFRTVIECKNYTWKFLHRAYYLNNVVQLEEDTPPRTVPTPPAGTAPYHLSEKSCALRK